MTLRVKIDGLAADILRANEIAGELRSELESVVSAETMRLVDSYVGVKVFIDSAESAQDDMKQLRDAQQKNPSSDARPRRKCIDPREGAKQ